MPSLRTLYAFKLQCFLGPVRRQPAVIALVVVVAVLFLPGAFFVGYFFASTPFGTVGLLGLGATGLSVFVAFYLSQAFSGGLLLHPAELDFVAIAPVSVRRFVLADLLFQATVYGVGLPAVLLAALGYALGTGAPLWSVLVVLASFTGLGLTAGMAVQVLGIGRLLRKPWAVPATVALILIMFAPAFAAFAFGVPWSYASLPYPTTAAVQVALLPFGQGDWIGVPVLLAYLGTAFVAHTAITARGSLPNLRSTFAFAAVFEPGLGKQLQAQAFLRLFGRFRRSDGARLNGPTLLGSMTRLHFVRMVRDGTLFMVVMLSAVFGALLFGLPEAAGIGAGYIVILVPVAAIGQWMQTDRPNLWLFAVSGARPRAFFEGWWISLGAFTAAAGALLSFLPTLAAGRPDAGVAIVLAGGSLGGVAFAVVAAAKFPYVPTEFSIRPFLHFILAGVGAGVGAVPVYAAMSVASLATPLAAPFAGLAALLLVVVVCRAVLAVGTRNPEWGA